MRDTMHVEVKVEGKWHHFTNNYLNIRVNGEMPFCYESNGFIFDTEQEPGVDPDRDERAVAIVYAPGTYINYLLNKAGTHTEESCITSKQIRILLASLKETEEAYITLSELNDDILKIVKCKSSFNIKVDDYRIIFRFNKYV